MYLDITREELEIMVEEIITFLGGRDINVDISSEEVLVSLRYALTKFQKETSIWQLQNQFINVYGMPAGLVLSNQLATVSFGLVSQITDWFASMSRVGGKIPWHKDYITLSPNRQVYFLDKESSKPYPSGSRRIHRVMWFAKPEILMSRYDNSSGYGDDVLQNNSWNFSSNGLNYGNSKLGFLGYSFDTVLMMQSIETRNKIVFSEFFHNLSGDVLEITPQPGNSLGNIPEGSRVYYYYWNESERLAGGKIDELSDDAEILGDLNNPDITSAQKNLIANPLDMNIKYLDWSSLSPWAKAFCKDMAFARCKYIQASKWRKIQKTFAGGEMQYEITFDYSSLLSEAAQEEEALINNLRNDLKELNMSNLAENQKNMVESAKQINKGYGRIWKMS